MSVTDTRQPQVYSAIIITYYLALLALGLRLLARRLVKSKYGLDDVFAMVALVIFELDVLFYDNSDSLG